jgi:hypothetical protein
VAFPLLPKKAKSAILCLMHCPMSR